MQLSKCLTNLLQSMVCLYRNTQKLEIFIKNNLKSGSFKTCVCYSLFFSPNDIPAKTMKNAFYFIRKAVFILKIFKFLFFPFLSTLSRFKRTNKTVKIYVAMNCRSYFWNGSKTALCYIIRLGQVIQLIKEFSELVLYP